MTLYKVNQRFFDAKSERHNQLLPIECYDDMPLLSLKMSVENLERLIPKVTENANIALAQFDHSEQGLSHDESASICLYTMNWKNDDQALCSQLNKALRSKDRSELIPYMFYLKLVLSALWKLESIRGTVWRGVKEDLSQHYPIGKSFIWWGFSSCLKSLNELQSERFLGKMGTRTIFQIECETGKAIGEHSYNHDTHEILLLPGIQLQVIDRIRPTNDLCVIRLREIRSSMSHLESLITSTHVHKLIKEEKPSSAPLPSNNCGRTQVSMGQRSKSLCTSVVTFSEPDKKSAKKPAKPYHNKLLSESIKTERESESVRFSKQMLNYEDMEIIANEIISNKHWKMIHLWENCLNERHMSILIQGLKLNSTLICLNLDNNLLSDEGATVLASFLKTNTKIRTVYLNKNQINEAGAQALANMLCSNTTLTHLELSSNSMGDDGILAICKSLNMNNTLRTIHLNDNNVTEVGAQHIAQMLQANISLNDLELSSNPIGDNGVSVISQALQSNRTLQSLHLGNTHITVNCISELGKMIETNKMLKSLCLNENNLGDDELTGLIKKLVKNTTLTNLDISRNNLTSKIANELAYLLEEAPCTLAQLNLGYNSLGDKGISMIASSLTNNNTLTKLFIESISMTIDGVRELTKMLSSNTSLRYLALNNNKIDDDSLCLLVDCLKTNTTLEHLYLNNCNLKDRCAPLIAELMQQNQTLVTIELVKNQLSEKSKMELNQAAILSRNCSIYLDFSFQRMR